MWLLKHKKKKVVYCHIFPHFGQILPSTTLLVVPLKLIEMLAEERHSTKEPAQCSGAKRRFFICWISNGSSVCYLRTSVNSSSMQMQLFQRAGGEKYCGAPEGRSQAGVIPALTTSLQHGLLSTYFLQKYIFCSKLANLEPVYKSSTSYGSCRR